MELILASASPRRRELLSLIGLTYRVCPSCAPERTDISDPAELVMANARIKANDIFKANPSACIIGADTVVYIDGRIIGKPADEADAKRILHTLSGRTHTVYTGVAVLCGETALIEHEATPVTFAELSDAEIDRYVATGEPLDKAGAYGVQGPAAVFVTHIDGCYFNIIGMPLPRLYRMLGSVGIM